MSNVTKSNAYNWGGVCPQSAKGSHATAPARLGLYTSWNTNAKKEGEDDEAYSGQRNTRQGYDITGGHSEPEIEIKIRPDDIIGDLIRGFLGGCTSAKQGTTIAYSHEFEESEDGDLPLLGLFQGYNVGSGEDGKPKRVDDCAVTKLSTKFSTKDTPSMTANLLGNLPEYGITEPSLVYPTPRIPPLLASQTRVYLDPVDGANPIGTTLMSGWMEGNVDMDNQIEADTEQGADFGTVVLDMGALKVEGGFKRRHIDTDLERQHITGSATGITPVEKGENYMLRFVQTGSMIKDVSGVPTIYPYKFQQDVLNIEITEAPGTESGDGSKTYDIKYIASPDDTGATVKMLLQNKIPTFAPV